jgi:hypothetical protein
MGLVRAIVIIAAWLIAMSATADATEVNSLPSSPPVVASQLVYCPVGSTVDYKCTFAQVSTFVLDNLGALPICTPGSTVAPVPTGQPFQCGGVILIAQ